MLYMDNGYGINEPMYEMGKRNSHKVCLFVCRVVSFGMHKVQTPGWIGLAVVLALR